MLFHVTVTYPFAANPTQTPGFRQQLVDIAHWMGVQKEMPVQVVSVHWGVNQPVGFGVFEAPDPQTMRSFMGYMPGTPSIDIDAIAPLDAVVAEAQRAA